MPGGSKLQFSLDGTTFAVDSTSFEWLVVTPEHKVRHDLDLASPDPIAAGSIQIHK